MLTAAVTAEGPGIGCIFKFSSIHLLMSIIPVSEIVGVPASDIKETILLFFIKSITLMLIFFSSPPVSVEVPELELHLLLLMKQSEQELSWLL